MDGEEYYGQQAKNFLVRNSKNTVAYFKDLLGKTYVPLWLSSLHYVQSTIIR